MKRLLILFLLSFVISGCASMNNPFKRSTFKINEGYLSVKNINENLQKQMPSIKKIGKNELKIVSVTLYASANPNNVIVEADYIFTSFEIPEGLPIIARFSGSISYDAGRQTFNLDQLKIVKNKVLKKELVEYITPQQKKMIPYALLTKLEDLILYKSRRKLRTVRKIVAKEGQIKVIF